MPEDHADSQEIDMELSLDDLDEIDMEPDDSDLEGYEYVHNYL